MARVTAFLIALALTPAAPAAEYLVEAELWLNGEAAGTPVLLVNADEPATIERDGGDEQSGWRLTIEVERADADPLAPSGSLWLIIELQQQFDGAWQVLADSMLGVPEGETATLSVVDGDAEPLPETAAVYLRVKTSRLVESEDSSAP
jgi:hypothetical protein